MEPCNQHNNSLVVFFFFFLQNLTWIEFTEELRPTICRLSSRLIRCLVHKIPENSENVTKLLFLFVFWYRVRSLCVIVMAFILFYSLDILNMSCFYCKVLWNCVLNSAVYNDDYYYYCQVRQSNSKSSHLRDWDRQITIKSFLLFCWKISKMIIQLPKQFVPVPIIIGLLTYLVSSMISICIVYVLTYMFFDF